MRAQKFPASHILMLAFLAASLAPCSQPAQAAKSETGTLFCQESKVLGATNLIVAKSGIRLEVPKTKMILVAHAPDWKLILVSDELRKYFVTEKNNFRAPAALAVTLYRSSDSSILKAKTEDAAMLLGRKVCKIEMLGEQPSKQISRKWQRLALHSATSWVDRSFALPPDIVRAVEAMYTLPSNKALPLQVITVNNKGSIEKELVLLKVTNRSVTAADFTVPQKYAAVKKQEELINQKSEEIMDLIPGS